MPRMSKRKRIVIKGDKISQQELIEKLNKKRISYMKLRMEEIRVNDSMDEMQKASKRSEIMCCLRQLERGM